MRKSLLRLLLVLLIISLLVPPDSIAFRRTTAELGINFRATDDYDDPPGDGTNEEWSGGENTPKSLNGFSFVWNQDITPDSRNRDDSIDHRLVGLIFTDNTGDRQRTLTITLPFTGDATIRAAFGDATNATSYLYAQFRDNGTPFETRVDTNGTSSGNFLDATGAEYSAANWPGSNTAITHTFTSTTFQLVIGSPDAQVGLSIMAHLYISITGEAGGGTKPKTLTTMGVGRPN